MKTNINNIKVLKESGLTMKTILSFSPNQIKKLTKKIQESSDDSQEIAALYSKKAELEALLLSPEFQALSQPEKEEILKEYGHESTTGLQ